MPSSAPSARSAVTACRADRHDARLAALAEHAHFAAVEIEIEPAQADQFGQAQAAGIEQLEHRAVAHGQFAAAVSFDQRAGLVHIQHLRQLAPHLGTAHAQHGVMVELALARELAKQAAAGREQPLQALRCQTFLHSCLLPRCSVATNVRMRLASSASNAAMSLSCMKRISLARSRR